MMDTPHFLQETIKEYGPTKPGVLSVKKYSIFFAFLLLLTGYSALAAKVSAVKNNKIMIELEGESASAGAEFFVLNGQNKKVALVKVTQAKGGRAIAEIIKGSAKPGYLLQAKGGGGSMSTSSSSKSDSSSDDYYDRKLNQKMHNGNSWGIVGGYLMNSMVVSTTSMQINMSGSGFGALGYYDYALSPSLVFRGMAGLETFNVAGSNSAASPSNCTTNCDVQIQYLSFYGYGRWNFMQGQYKSWIGGGAGYLMPTQKPGGSVFANNTMGANQIFVVAGGMDYRLSAKNYLPISLEYGLYPSTATVKAQIIYLRVGYAWNL
jgi:hypothetical protein